MRTRCQLLTAALLGILPFGGLACTYPSQPGDYHKPPPDVPVEGVRVSPQSILFSALGETKLLTADIFPANATDQAISWESTDSTVATVDASGQVTARGVGAGVLITAISHDGGHQSSATATVDVTPPSVPVDGIRVTPQSIQLDTLGETFQLMAVISPANASDQTAIWESSDSTVASVNAAGLVTARSVGSGIFITAFSHDRAFQGTVNVRVNP